MTTYGRILVFFGMMAALLVTQGTASAREIITLTQANGGTYMVMAYNTTTRSYYYINGDITSDSHEVTVTKGYGSTVNVTLGRAVGSRNMYEERDPLSPILEVSKKSSYVLELTYRGRRSSGVNALQVPSLPGGIGGAPGPFQRQPPP